MPHEHEEAPELTRKCKFVMADAMAALGTELLTHFGQDHPIFNHYNELSEALRALIVTPEEEAEMQDELGNLIQELLKKLNAPNN